MKEKETTVSFTEEQIKKMQDTFVKNGYLSTFYISDGTDDNPEGSLCFKVKMTRKEMLEEVLKSTYDSNTREGIEKEINQIEVFEKEKEKFNEAMSNHVDFKKYILEIIKEK